MAIASIKAFAVLILTLLLWPLLYSVWLSFSPSEFMEPPIFDWSLQWYQQFFSDPRWIASVAKSFEIASLTVVLSLALALSLAVYEYEFGLSKAFKVMVMLPFLVPPMVLAMGLLPWMHFIGLWGTSISIATSHTMMAFPVAFLILSEGLSSQSKNLKKAAQSLGARPIVAYRLVIIPVLMPWVATAALIAMVISINEFIIAQFLSAPGIETLPTVIWPNLRYTLTPVVAAASTFTLLLTIPMALLLRRRMSRARL